jgi:urease accessory protein
MRRALLAIALALAPSLALAHPGPIGHTHDFVSGVVHPVTGIDHVLAMVAVGLFAAQLGGRALWAVPASFVTVMALAGLAGMAGVEIPMTEAGIALSVVVLGAAIALRLAMPVAAAMGLVALFAVFHGYAHGTEMPETASGLMYGLGFVIATAALHAVGIGLGLSVAKLDTQNSRRLIQLGGGVAAVIGAVLLVHTI